jgi:hypothetical protein
MDMSNQAVADRLQRVYACTSHGEVCKVYGVRGWDSAAWHRERDERTLAKAYMALLGPAAKLVAAVTDNVDFEDDPQGGRIDRMVKQTLRAALAGVQSQIRT